MFATTLKKASWITAALFVVWVPLHMLLLIDLYALDWRVALLDATAMAITLAVFGFGMLNVFTFYQPDKKRMPYVILAALILAYGSAWVAEQLILSFMAESFHMKAFQSIRVALAVLMSMLMLALAWMQSAKKSSTEDDERKLAVEKMAREAELASLRQQLQPHFLFNSLNSINALIGSQPEKARKMVQQLSDFLRGTVKKDDSQLVPLFEELQQLRLYLDIEKVRFGHRLATEIENDNASLSALLPPLLMQPVVENAIKFGLYDTLGETVIRVKIFVDAKQLVIEVENPFDATTATPRHGTGFGLSSLQRRLYLLYARNDLLQTRQTETTFITQIRIPQA